MIVLLILASILVCLWGVFLGMARKEDWVAAVSGKIIANIDKIDEFRSKEVKNKKAIVISTGIVRDIKRLFIKESYEKETKKLEAQNNALRKGNLKGLSVLDISGYVVLRMLPDRISGQMRKPLITMFAELNGRKYSEVRASALLAKLISYPFIAIPLVLALGVIVMNLNSMQTGITVIVAGVGVALVLDYALYDDVTDRLRKRKAEIARHFPNVVSKLALLVTSGMIMDRAWRETAVSADSALYIEMRKTADDISNLMDPISAYGGFIDRCNTKETTKLAAAIIQNHSKGNAEIGQLLKGMASEAWLERRHRAKRDSEAANSKLMIPTMMLFMAILIMIMVPVLTNFTSMTI